MTIPQPQRKIAKIMTTNTMSGERISAAFVSFAVAVARELRRATRRAT